MHRTYKFALCTIVQWPWTMDREISSCLCYFVPCFGAFLNTHHMKKMAISTLDRLRQFPFTLGKKRRGVQIGFCFCVRSLSTLSPFSFLLFFFFLSFFRETTVKKLKWELTWGEEGLAYGGEHGQGANLHPETLNIRSVGQAWCYKYWFMYAHKYAMENWIAPLNEEKTRAWSISKARTGMEV